jgi:translation initiation factor 1 (eIF-1/SUI1)
MAKIHWYKIVMKIPSGKEISFSVPASRQSYIVSKLESHFSKKLAKNVSIKDGDIEIEGKKIAKIVKIIRLANSPKKEKKKE